MIFAASAADIGGLNSRTIPDLSGKQKCRVPSEIKSKLHSYNLRRAPILVNDQGCQYPGLPDFNQISDSPPSAPIFGSTRPCWGKVDS